MVSSVPLLDLVQKVTTGHSESDLGELREMLESLLTAYNFELKVFERVITVYKQDVHEAKSRNRRLCVCGSRVDSVVDVELKPESAHEVSQIMKASKQRFDAASRKLQQCVFCCRRPRFLQPKGRE